MYRYVVERKAKDEIEWTRWMKKVAASVNDGVGGGGGGGGGEEGDGGASPFPRRRSMSAGDLEEMMHSNEEE